MDTTKYQIVLVTSGDRLGYPGSEYAIFETLEDAQQGIIDLKNSSDAYDQCEFDIEETEI